MLKSLALACLLVSLTGCAGFGTQPTLVYVPPSSCLEPPAELPEPTADVIDYAELVTGLYGDLATQRMQCRNALIKSTKE